MDANIFWTLRAACVTFLEYHRQVDRGHLTWPQAVHRTLWGDPIWHLRGIYDPEVVLASILWWERAWRFQVAKIHGGVTTGRHRTPLPARGRRVVRSTKLES